MTELDRLIFGKNPTERIVSIEPVDNKALLYIQDVFGNISIKEVSHKYWVLGSKPQTGFVRLKGDLPYKYGRQFETLEAYRALKTYNGDYFQVWNAQEAMMIKDGFGYYKNMQLNEISVFSFDLETTTLKFNKDSKILCISTTFRSVKGVKKRLFAYDEYATQGEMIVDFCTYLRECDPSIVLGHNVNGFDLSYLKYISSKECVELLLGRDGSAMTTNKKESKYRIDGSMDLHYHKNKIFGREIIDTMFLSYKYDSVSKKYASYGLKYIIEFEKLIKPGRTFYDANLIRKNYLIPEEWIKIKNYCIDDSDDALSLFDKMGPVFFYMASSVPKTFQGLIESASGSQINAMLLRSYLQDAHSIPRRSDTTEPVKGGISFGIPGIYKNVVKVDLKSAYPSQILRFKLYDKQKDPNANFYKITKYYTELRFSIKAEMKKSSNPFLKIKDGAAKVFINSMFGGCNTPGLNFNSPELASKITAETRKMIDMSLIWASGKNTEYWMEEFKKYAKK